MKKILILSLVSLFCLNTYAANIYSPKQIIRYDQVAITLSDSLDKTVNHELLNQVVKQINSLPVGIPKILEIRKESEAPLQDTTLAKIAKVTQLWLKTGETNVFQVHIAYEPGEDYTTGLAVGKVWASNAGLILLNDIRLKAVADDPVDEIYLVNLILHELMHIWGLDHSSRIDFKVTNQPVMNLGKFGKLGLGHDDIAGLLENYDIQLKNRVTLVVRTNGEYVSIISEDKKRRAQSKFINYGINNGSVIFPQVIKGKYSVYVDGVKIKSIKLNKNQELIINKLYN